MPNPLTDLGARLIIAHRGNAADAPENTIESFAQAIALGADALEFDVRVTRDGVPVVIHDETLYRTTGQRDFVAEMTAKQLSHADAGATAVPPASTTRIEAESRHSLESGSDARTASTFMTFTKTSA